MAWTILSLVIIGLLLLFVELFVLPGVTIAGIGGALFILGGVYFSFSTYGSFVGTIVLLLVIIISIIALIYAFKAKTWRQVTLGSSIDSKVNVIPLDEVMVGDTAKTISGMRPHGKIMLNEKYYEAQSLNGLIEQDTMVEIVKVARGKIIVKPLN